MKPGCGVLGGGRTAATADTYCERPAGEPVARS